MKTQKNKMIIYISPATRLMLDTIYTHQIGLQMKQPYSSIVEKAIEEYFERCKLPVRK